MINCEVFKKEDNDEYLHIDKLVQSGQLRPDKVISYTDHFGVDLRPETISVKLLSRKVSRYMDDFHVNIYSMDNIERTYWTQHTGYLGIYNKGKFDLYVRDKDIMPIALCWIILHEFRHHMQWKNGDIASCQGGENYNILRQQIISKFEISDAVYEHVFHEIIPHEVDANTFACETLGIEYPSSKFAVTHESLKCLNENVINPCFTPPKFENCPHCNWTGRGLADCGRDGCDHGVRPIKSN